MPTTEHKTILRWGNSQGVRLSKRLLEQANITENDEIELTALPNKIVIKKVEKTKRVHKTIEERFKDFNGTYEKIEIDWGKPEGKEVW